MFVYFNQNFSLKNVMLSTVSKRAILFYRWTGHQILVNMQLTFLFLAVRMHLFQYLF